MTLLGIIFILSVALGCLGLLIELIEDIKYHRGEDLISIIRRALR